MGTYEPKLQITEVRIPSAQVKTLVASPVAIVPAPGVGKSLIPLWATVTLDYKGTPYTWANTNHSLVIIGATTVNDAMAQACIKATGDYTLKFLAPVATVAMNENEAITLVAGGTGEPAAGNSELVVRVAYFVVDNDAA